MRYFSLGKIVVRLLGACPKVPHTVLPDSSVITNSICDWCLHVTVTACAGAQGKSMRASSAEAQEEEEEVRPTGSKEDPAWDQDKPSDATFPCPQLRQQIPGIIQAWRSNCPREEQLFMVDKRFYCRAFSQSFCTCTCILYLSTRQYLRILQLFKSNQLFSAITQD